MKKEKKKNQITETVLIRDLRCRHIGNSIAIKAKLIQASKVRPQIISARFRCSVCKSVINKLQIEKYFCAPDRCSCGNNKKFELLNKDMIDVQRIVIGQGKKVYDEDYKCKVEKEQLKVFLKGELCDPKYKIIEHLGKLIRVSGIIRDIPKEPENGGILVRTDLVMVAESLEVRRT